MSRSSRLFADFHVTARLASTFVCSAFPTYVHSDDRRGGKIIVFRGSFSANQRKRVVHQEDRADTKLVWCRRPVMTDLRGRPAKAVHEVEAPRGTTDDCPRRYGVLSAIIEVCALSERGHRNVEDT